jgi:hypothetical protein
MPPTIQEHKISLTSLEIQYTIPVILVGTTGKFRGLLNNKLRRKEKGI